MPILPLKYRRVFAGAGATALVVVWFCRHLLRGNPGVFFNDDYQLSILPVFADVARSWGEGHWPLLSPYSWACGNLAGEYQYGTFSVFINAVVVVVWKFPLTFAQQAAALSITHLAVLAAGGYVLARGRRLPAALAAGVGIIAALNGWEVGWGATDWFGALAANAWLPWCWWAFEVALRPGTGGEGWRGRLRFLLPAPFVYLLVAAGFPYTDVMLGLVTGWLAVRSWAERGWQWRTPFVLGTGWVLGLMLSAPAWLSLLDAVHGSGRSQEGVGVGNLAWTVPWRSLPGLILPNWTVPWRDFANLATPHGALELTGGFVPVVGLIAGLARWRKGTGRAWKWDLGLLGVTLLLCLLPSPGLFRWSFRWLPLFHLVLALTGARALQRMEGRRQKVEGRRQKAEGRRQKVEGRRQKVEGRRQKAEGRRQKAEGRRQKAEGRRQKAEGRGQRAEGGSSGTERGGVAGGSGTRGWTGNAGVWATAAVVATWGAMRLFQTADPAPLTRGMPVGMLTVAVAWAVLGALPVRRSWRLWVPTLAVLAATFVGYRYARTNNGLPVYPVPQTLAEVAPLSPERLYLSFYREPDQFYRYWQTPPGYGAVVRMGSMGMYAGVRMLNGYSPIMSRGVGKELRIETHGNVPGAVGERLLTQEAGSDGLLARLGVDGLILTHDYGSSALPPAAGWERVLASEEADVYERRGGALPGVRAWTSPEPGAAEQYAAAAVRVIEDTRQRVEADVSVPAGGAGGLIAFSRPFQAGYRATLDGVRLPVGSFRGLMPTVEVPAGWHGRLVLRYLPRAVVWGGIVAAAGGLLAVGLAVWKDEG